VNNQQVTVPSTRQLDPGLPLRWRSCFSNLHNLFQIRRVCAVWLLDIIETTVAIGVTGVEPMLWTIFLICFVLWFLGLVSSYTLGGFIHLLLVLALAVLVIGLIEGRRPAV
jgi:hypothetical protein